MTFDGMAQYALLRGVYRNDRSTAMPHGSGGIEMD
jgi:hypothetical protein